VIALAKTKLPKFPDSYTGDRADEYDSLKWMERNQKRTTLITINYLFDEKLGKSNYNLEKDLPLTILDLGCGTGFSSLMLVEVGFRVIGVDILPDMLSKANKKIKMLDLNNIMLILADINYLPLRNHSIHFITSISAYNFIIHDKNSRRNKRMIVNNTARYISKILKINGRMVIEFYPENDEELKLFSASFIENGFEGFMVKNIPKQKSGQTFLLLKKKR
jgi:ubiquinone/menaquinone biosynthesis C-methylase UbiE